MKLFFIFSIQFLLISTGICQHYVDIPEGRIYGMIHYTVQLNKFLSFAGIPYAYDTSQKRFQPSSVYPLEELLANEDGVFNATKISICPQDALIDPIIPPPDSEIFQKEGKIDDPAEAAKIYETLMEEMMERKRANIAEGGVMGDEDCLALTINTPMLPGEEGFEPMPVIVFLHGGGSDAIWSSIWNGLRFMNHRVVLISINYRLGILGGLNLGINEAPGNAALYDALTCLKWIKSYIHHFGGDPNKVTITGQSAGAMMVTHLMASPLANGYYHGVIGSSGSATAVWGTARRPSMPYHLGVARHAECYNEEELTDEIIQAILQCMQSKTFTELVLASNAHKTDQEHLGLGFGYDDKVGSVQDSEKITIEKIVPEHPLDVYKRGDQNNVPLMMGSMRHDGSYFMDKLYVDYIKYNGLERNVTFMKNHLLTTLMNFIGLEDIDDRSSGNMIYALGKNHMKDAFRSETLEPKFPGLIDLTTVFGMKAASFQLVELHEKIQKDVYYYDFDYKGMWTFYYLILVDADSIIPGGVAHTDDTIYLFQFFPLIWNNDLIVSNRFTKYWVNFATYGNPNGPDGSDEVWPAYARENQRILVIKKDDFVYEGNVRDRWVDVAHELYPNGIPPLPED